MPTNNEPPERGDRLAEMLSRGEAPSFDQLLALSPDEPLAVMEEGDAPRTTPSDGGAW
jgi:hypothetical protein